MRAASSASWCDGRGAPVSAIVENAAMTAAVTTFVIPRPAWRLGALAPALAAALLAAGCATRPAPAPPRAAAVPASTPPAVVVAGKPAPVPVPAVPSEDETLPGVRYGATRAELLAAYPGAECSSEHCT